MDVDVTTLRVTTGPFLLGSCRYIFLFVVLRRGYSVLREMDEAQQLIYLSLIWLSGFPTPIRIICLQKMPHERHVSKNTQNTTAGRGGGGGGAGIKNKWCDLQ